MKLLSASLLALVAPVVFCEDWNSGEFPGTVSSWADGRLDIFIEEVGVLYHKYHANADANWNSGYEIMDFPAIDRSTRPASISWAENRLDIFAISGGDLVHKFWDGSQWQPESGAETLGSGVYGNLAVASWAEGRFDIIGSDRNYNYVHKWWDGSQWNPSGNKMESLGTDGLGNQAFRSDPAVVSWGENRLDIFGILFNGTLAHKYWDGSQWQPSATGWESWGDDLSGTPIATSWAENRLDVWALNYTGEGKYHLAHRYWTGTYLADWESLGGEFSVTPTVTHWSANRTDIFGMTDGSLVYKYWDGYQWNPSDVTAAWNPHGSGLITAPVSVNWNVSNVHSFTFDGDYKLRWQFWIGGQWLPSYDASYDLGTLPNHVYAKSKPDSSFVVQDPERHDL